MTGILGGIAGTNVTKKIVPLGVMGSLQNKTSSSSETIVATAGIPAGTLLVFATAYDSSGSGTPTVSTLSASGGGTWTQRANGSSTATGAGNGIFLYTYTTLTTTEIAPNANITTVTLSGATIAKAMAVWAFGFVNNTLRNTAVTATSTAGTPSAVTAGTALVAGDLVIGTIGGETNALPTGDTDTLNGSWSTITGTNTTGGGAATNVAVGMQYKIVTATGAQTYNPVTANDSVASVFALTPA